MSWPLDLGAYALQDRRHAWKAVYRLSAWMAYDLPSGLSSRVRPVCLSSILLAKDRAVELVADRSGSEHCRLTPLCRRLRQKAATMALSFDDPSGIEKTETKGYQAADASLDRPLPSLQVALAAAGQGHQVHQRWAHQDCPS